MTTNRIRARWVVIPLVFLAILGASQAAVTALSLPKLITLPIAAVLTLLIDQVAKPWLASRRSTQERERSASDVLRQHLGRRGVLPKVRDCDPLLLGVHEAISLEDSEGQDHQNVQEYQGRLSYSGLRNQELDPRLPAYFERDEGARFRSWLSNAESVGGFALIVGESSTGKTRFLFESVRESLPDWRLLDPANSEAVAILAQSTVSIPKLVIWLDELQEYLEGPWLVDSSTSLAATAIKQLLDGPEPVIVVGTIWPDRYNELRGTELEAQTGREIFRHPIAYGVLKLVGFQVTMPDSPTEKENVRATKLAAFDPRLSAGLNSRDYGLTQILAGAPWLVRRWEAAPNAYCKAVITAAIDIYRLGVRPPFSAGLLCDAARIYLTRPEEGDDWFEEALLYAAESRRHEGTTAAFLTVADESNRIVIGYAVSDYLLQYGLSIRGSDPVPVLVWQTVVDHKPSNADPYELGERALRFGAIEQAEQFYGQAIAAGDTVGYWALAILLEKQGRSIDAEAAWRSALAAGYPVHARLAALLESLGKAADAEEVWRMAVASGHRIAYRLLAWLLERNNREDEAQDVYRQAIAQGRSGAYKLLAQSLERQDRLTEAAQVWQEAIVAGVVDAYRSPATRLAELQRRQVARG